MSGADLILKWAPYLGAWFVASVAVGVLTGRHFARRNSEDGQS